MNGNHPTRRGFAWLELLLVLAILVLLFELFPSLWWIVLAALNPRNWTRPIWIVVNLIVVLFLLTVRFGPQLVEDWRLRKNRLAVEQTKQHKQQELKEQRESLNRMKQAQRRRIY